MHSIVTSKWISLQSHCPEKNVLKITSLYLQPKANSKPFSVLKTEEEGKELDGDYVSLFNRSFT